MEFLNKKQKKLNIFRWKEHPWNENNMVAELDVNFLKSIANQKATEYTDMIDGNIVHQKEVWNDIKVNGLFEPLLIVIGSDEKTIRLESGNHRITTAIEDGYTHLPTAILISRESILKIGNGIHKYKLDNIIDWNNIIKCNYPYQGNPELIFLKKFLEDVKG